MAVKTLLVSRLIVAKITGGLEVSYANTEGIPPGLDSSDSTLVFVSETLLSCGNLDF